MSEAIYIAGGMRTAVGGLSGVLADVGAKQLGAQAIKAALESAGVDPAKVDEVIMGNVLSAGLGQNIARQASMAAGLPSSVGAMTVNKVCGSGLKSVMLAAQAIRCGEAQVVVAGGTENMSQSPYLLPKARQGYRMGHGELVDSLIHDGLWDSYNNLHMGTFGDRCAAKYEITRNDQDNFAVASYQRAQRAAAEGIFADEITPVEITDRKGNVTRIDSDEGPARFNEEKLRKLRPAFGAEGTVTAGNASSINDGAAAVVVLSAEAVEKLGVKPQAKILGFASYSREPEWFTLAPIGAIRKVLEQTGKKVSNIDLFEINEAFSAVALAAMKELEIPHEKVNVHGGAVAIGHPIGASGTRTLVTLLNAMAKRKARLGLDTLCIGGGEAVAMVVERCA